MSDHPNRERPLTATNDGALLSCFSETGDQQAFSQIVARHGPMVLRLCRRMSGGDPHGAEDAAQQVFLMLASRAGALKTRLSVAGWLYRTSWYVATRQRRERSLRGDHEARAAAERAVAAAALPLDDIPFAVVSSELSDALNRALANLPEGYRNALVLHHIAGYTVEETACMLDVKVGTAASWMSRGRSLLRERLETLLAITLTTQIVDDWLRGYPAPRHFSGDDEALLRWGSSPNGTRAMAGPVASSPGMALGRCGSVTGRAAGVAVAAAAMPSLQAAGSVLGVTKPVAIAATAVTAGAATVAGSAAIARRLTRAGRSTEKTPASDASVSEVMTNAPSSQQHSETQSGFLGGSAVPEPTLILPLLLAGITLFLTSRIRRHRRPAAG